MGHNRLLGSEPQTQKRQGVLAANLDGLVSGPYLYLKNLSVIRFWERRKP
jgi:hypothetical protein